MDTSYASWIGQKTTQLSGNLHDSGDIFWWFFMFSGIRVRAEKFL